jgi:hypothetical protein
MKFTKRDMPERDDRGPGIFLKFKDGESKTGVCRGEVYEFFQVWENGKSQVVARDHADAKSRFRLNFVILEDGKFVPKIFEFGIVVYNLLAEISEEYDLEKTKVKITRRGTGTDTVYMVLPLLKEPISAKTMKEIEAVPLNILEHKERAKDFNIGSFLEAEVDDDGMKF